MTAVVVGYIVEFAVAAAVSYAISYAMAPDGQDMEGPKLENLRVGKSKYGAPIARVYGTMRVPGQMVWFKNNQLNHYTYRTNAGGGKGGPSSGKMTNHVYTVTGAWAICEGEISGIRKIWAGNILIYNAADDASGNDLKRATRMYSDLRIYTGSSSQEPDSLIVADKGHTPAYRGIAYVVIDDLELKKFGNIIPDLKFEVVRDAAPAAGDLLTTTAAGININNYYPTFATDAVVYWRQVQSPTTDILLTDSDGDIKGRVPVDNGSDVAYPAGQGIVNGFNCASHNFDSTVDEGYRFVATNDDGVELAVDLQWLIPSDEKVSSTVFCADDTHVMLLTKAPGAAVGSQQLHAWYLLTVYNGGGALVDSGTVATGIMSGSLNGSSKSGYLGSGTTCSVLEPDLKHIWHAAGTTGSPVSCYKIDFDGELSLVLNVNTFLSSGSGNRPGIYAEGGVCTVLTGSNIGVITRVERFEQAPQDIGAITRDLMMQSGLESADIDIAELTEETLDGYAILNRESLRSDIEPLMGFAHFDLVETQGKLKAVKRGGPTVKTLTADDLAAHEFGQDRPETITEEVKLEEELLKEVSLTFVDKARDYNDGQTHAAQLNTDSVNKVQRSFPIAMTRDKATQLASIVLDNDWLTRRSFQWALPQQFSYLEPTDPVIIQNGSDAYEVRITNIQTGANGIMECSGQLHAPSVYTSVAVGADIENPDPDNLIYGPSIPYFLDIPLIRGAQTGTFESGYYVGVTGVYSTWPGASGFVSLDGGATFNSFGSVSVPAIIGRCTTTLPDADTGVIDYGSTLRVELLTPAATLDSVSREAMNNGSNWAIVGIPGAWEVIKFQTATLVGVGIAGGNVYDLTILSRGRRGTEHLVAGHASGETFIMIDDRVQRIPMETDSIGKTYKYAAITYGSDIQDGIIYDFANTAIGMRPYSPSHVKGARSGSGDITITFERRTRYGGEWRNSVDITDSDPMDFEIDVMSGSTVVRTISTATESATYTAAQQVTDFGSTQSSVTVRVYQINTVYGRGQKAEETI